MTFFVKMNRSNFEFHRVKKDITYSICYDFDIC